MKELILHKEKLRKGIRSTAAAIGKGAVLLGLLLCLSLRVYASEEYEEQSMNGEATVTSNSLNVRSGPGTGYSVLGMADKGDVLPVTGATSNGWYQVIFESDTGYVSGKYVTVVDTGVAAGEDEEESTGGGNGYLSQRVIDSAKTVLVIVVILVVLVMIFFTIRGIRKAGEDEEEDEYEDEEDPDEDIDEEYDEDDEEADEEEYDGDVEEEETEESDRAVVYAKTAGYGGKAEKDAGYDEEAEEDAGYDGDDADGTGYDEEAEKDTGYGREPAKEPKVKAQKILITEEDYRVHIDPIYFEEDEPIPQPERIDEEPGSRTEELHMAIKKLDELQEEIERLKREKEGK